MQTLKERKSLLIKILAVVLLVILCCKLPGELMFWYSCTKQDRNIPPNTEIIVSACKRPTARGVPGGDSLFVREGLSGRMYLLDLRTGKKKNVPNDPLLLDNGIFLNSELVWLEGRKWLSREPVEYVLDLNTGKRYELLNLGSLPRLPSGKFDTKNYTYIQSAQYVFLDHEKNIIIALSSDFHTNPSGRVFLSGIPLGDTRGESFVPLMGDLGVNYEIVPVNSGYADTYSPLEKYYLHNGSVHRSDTGAVVSKGLLSWYYDDSGVVLGNELDCVIPVPESCMYHVLGPIFKLKLSVP